MSTGINIINTFRQDICGLLNAVPERVQKLTTFLVQRGVMELCDSNTLYVGRPNENLASTLLDWMGNSEALSQLGGGGIEALFDGLCDISEEGKKLVAEMKSTQGKEKMYKVCLWM